MSDQKKYTISAFGDKIYITIFSKDVIVQSRIQAELPLGAAAANPANSGDEATEAQINYLNHLGGEVKEGMTKHEAAGAIADLLKKKKEPVAVVPPTFTFIFFIKPGASGSKRATKRLKPEGY